jgi:RNA recognition motif-containing protein
MDPFAASLDDLVKKERKPAPARQERPKQSQPRREQPRSEPRVITVVKKPQQQNGGGGGGKMRRERHDEVPETHGWFPQQAPQQTRSAPPAQTNAQKPAITLGAKVMVTGLDPAVTSEDIREIFGRTGAVKAVTILYDQRGQSKGAADVLYFARSSAVAAVDEFDGRRVDDAIIRVKLVSEASSAAPAPAPAARAQTSGGAHGLAGGFGTGGGRGGQQAHGFSSWHEHDEGRSSAPQRSHPSGLSSGPKPRRDERSAPRPAQASKPQQSRPAPRAPAPKPAPAPKANPASLDDELTAYMAKTE